MIKVGVLGIKGEFSDYKTSGTLFYRYMYYTTKSMMQQCKGMGIEIDRIEPEMIKSLGKGLSILLKTAFRNFGKYDVIHNFDLNPFFPARNGKMKIVTTAHDFQITLAPQYNAGLSRGLFGKVFIYIINPLAVRATLKSDYIIAVSTSTRDDCIKLGFDSKKVFVVNHGVDETFFKPVPKKKKKKFTVGYLGAMAPRKNPDFLMGTFRKLKGDDYDLQVWGKLGYERERILRLAGDDKRIHFNGFAPDDKFVDIYDSFDVFLWPSFYEGFSIPVIEAQARGLPVVIYKHGRIPPEVRKYCLEAGDEDDAVRLIEEIKKKGYDSKRRKKAMEYARGFTWERTAKETLQVYKNIAEGKV